MILAIDTSSGPASCAVVGDDRTFVEFTINNNKKTHSATLMPVIENMLALSEIDIAEIKFIACSSGPGSFTGLRIGAATAKGLAHALGVKIIPVPTLDSLAYNIFYTNKLICPIMDARRNQVYSAIYKWNGLNINRLTDYLACDIKFVIDKILSLNEEVIFLGDGVSVNQAAIVNSIPCAVFAPGHCNIQRAASLGLLAVKISANEKSILDYNEFLPFYLRKSQAEREAELLLLQRDVSDLPSNEAVSFI